MSSGKGGSYDLWQQPKGYHHHAGKTSADVSAGYPGRNDERFEERKAAAGKAPEEEEEERGHWGNKWEFILSCIGMSVGLGNVWRFPYLAYENGGAAFLIAYLVLQILVGKPLYLMELVIAQYSNLGPTRVWALNPLAKGIGVSMCIISFIVAIYYNVIMAYTLFYFFSSMQQTLPWMVCDDSWTNENLTCVAERTGPGPEPCSANVTYFEVKNLTTCECTFNATLDAVHNFTCVPPSKTSSELFFYKEVIELSPGLEPENLGRPLWRLALCLLLSWVVVILCLIKGIKSSGKVVYFTATFPYVILLILLVRGCLLDGAIDGIEFFIIPKWEKLLELKVWVAAAGQMFFSLSVCFGAIIMFGSYNKFNNNVYGDALLISIMDLVTSVIAGFVVFTTFGGMAKTIGTTVDKVAKSGYGLAFVAYPEALSNMPPPQLWSCLFFFMLFTLGLDSEFGLMETILTCIQDEAPKLRKYKSQMCVGGGILCYFLALPCVTPGGDYVVTMMDHYGADFSVLILAFFETVSVMWVYGVMNVVRDMEYMLGKKPHGWPFWVFTWAFAAPLIIAALVVYRMIKYSPPEYSEGVPYPDFAQGIGWAMMVVVLIPVPLYALYHACKTSRLHPGLSTGELLSKMVEPTDEWKPADGSSRLAADFPLDKVGGVDNPAGPFPRY